jgi:glycosyltransferase involved in cell wall biosynthesis
MAASSGIDLELRGETPNDEVRRLMLRSAVVVAPSLAEGFGLTLVEGFAAGAPAVASAVGGPLEIVTDGRDGLLVPPGDAGALAQALDAALEPATNRALSAAARATFERRFELSTRVRQIADWLEQRADAAAVS